MCEYCKKLKPILSVEHLQTRICVDGAHQTLIWRFDDDETIVQYDKINYCPMCGRRLDGENKTFPKKVIDNLAITYLKLHVPPDAEQSPKDKLLFRFAFAEGFEEALKHIK